MEENKNHFTLTDDLLRDLLITLSDSLEEAEEQLRDNRICQFERDRIIKLYLHFETPEERANRDRIMKYKYFAPMVLEQWEREHKTQPND